MQKDNNMAKAAMEMAYNILIGDLKEEAKNKIGKPMTYPAFFVKVISHIDGFKIIPPKYKELRTVLLGINKKLQKDKEEEVKRHVPKTQSNLTPRDIEHWVQTAKKGDKLIYYTGITFDKKSGPDASCFRKANFLAMDYDEVAMKNKKYEYRGHTKGEWGCTYKNIIDLIQHKVKNIQRDNEGNILSYPVYNYIMVKK